jgi:hypothetical protein
LNFPGLKSGARSGRSTNDAIPISYRDLTVGAKIRQRDDARAAMHLGRKNSSENIASDEATKAGQELNPWVSRERPIEIRGVNFLKSRLLTFKGGMGELLEIEVAEEMMHGGIAREEHAFDGKVAIPHRSKHALDLPSNLRANHLHQLNAPRFRKGVFNAIHEIGTVNGLWVSRALDGENVPRLQIEQLRHDRRRTEIDDNGGSRARCKLQLCVIRENRGLPLRYLENETLVGRIATSQTPAVCEFLLRKDLALIFRDGKKAIEHAGATPTAITTASTGKLDAESMQHVLKRRAPCHLQHRPKRLQLDFNRGTHRRSFLLPNHATKARLSHIDPTHG